ncbi:hypothetical protein BU14_0342s0009 [Porphyra umbilicalis]|uniref:Uncharacterized protein n=1 Tax=Porphyra umbilicalis TaxID=2786 RepID=A0A1X6NXX5_PORUM|nr:hypothetical protein BU14_0342s0009 [Porphyra umbilicalis]|eukprot:OSX73489.1 hypothetical protein BU14_0342s0009 [Porphyra umbilicalis]
MSRQQQDARQSRGALWVVVVAPVFNGSDLFDVPVDFCEKHNNAHPHHRTGETLKAKWSELSSFFWRTHKDFSRSGQNDPNLWSSFSKGDTLLDYLFYLFKGNDVVLELVSPEVGPAGVEGDIPPLAGHTTRTQPSNRGNRKREADIGEMERFAANAEKMATAVCKDADSRELANLSETLKNLRAAGADPRFIAADAISPSREGASGRAVGETQPLQRYRYRTVK